MESSEDEDVVCISDVFLQPDKEQHSWKCGDHCLSPWSGDTRYFPGTIKDIQRNLQPMLALVSYDDYSSSEDEKIDVRKLKKVDIHDKKKEQYSKDHDISEKSFFKPLDANGELERISAKYGSFDDEEIEKKVDSWFSPKKSTSVAKQRKLAVACGGADLPKEKTRQHRAKVKKHDTEQTETITEKTADVEPLASTSNNRTNDYGNVSPKPILGFDEDDMIKPKFNFPAIGTKVPFLLSSPEDHPAIQVPAGINQYLRDYQREGIKFLYSHYKHNRGAILGDDMGLGKTVQVIGFLSAILHKKGNREDVMRQKPLFIRQLSDNPDLLEDIKTGPVLIIGPGSVLYNWMDELDTWGYFTVGKFHGTEKQQCLSDLQKKKLDVVVTTFETFRVHQDELNMVAWEVVIADEVHKIKGLKAQTTQALRKIAVTRRFGLTGTALQNNMLELWSILDWAQPGCCGKLGHFENYFVSVIEKGQRHDATKAELALARKRKEEFGVIRENLMIRRLKSLIADQLPEKDDSVVFCKLSDLQASVYKTILEQPEVQVVLKMDHPCDCGSGRVQSRCCHQTTPDGRCIRSIFFSYLHLLLKTANHVALLIPQAGTSQLQSKYAQEICDIVFENYPQFVSQAKDSAFRTLSDPQYCGKMKILQRLLSVFYKDHSKVLVFSYSTKLLDIVEQYLMSTGYEYRRLDGKTSAKKRLDVVREFNKDPNIFICLISTKAGGLGLNLTGANKVVIFDPNWNPTHDLQAQDRAYRIGQSRNVQVLRLVSAGTIEENIYLRQIYKQQLDSVAVACGNAKRYFHGIQGDKNYKGELFGAKNMFQLRTGDSCLTVDILERNQKVEQNMTGFNIAKYIPHTASKKDELLEEEEAHDFTEKEVESSEELDIFDELFSPDESSDNDDMDTAEGKVLHKKVGQKDGGSNQLSGGHLTTGSAAQTPQKRPVPTVSHPPNKSAEENSSAQRKKEMRRQSIVEQDGSSLSFSSVGAILGGSDVLHIHKNRQVVGASKAEDHMSRCAMQDIYELHHNPNVPALQCEPISESSEEEPAPVVSPGKRKRNKPPDHNTPRTQVVDNLHVLVGQTPKFIKQQQVQQLCKFLGKTSLLDFAEHIFSSSVEERMSILDKFYESEDPKLKGLLYVEKEYTSEKQNIFKKDSTRKNKHDKVNLTRKTTASSTRNRKKKKIVTGVNYTLSDSESFEVDHKISQPSLKLTRNDSGQLEVGKPQQNTPNKRTVPSYVKSRLRSKHKTSTTTIKESRDLFETEDSAGSHWLEQQPMETSHFVESGNATSEHTEELLIEMGTHLDNPQNDLQCAKEEIQKTSCSNLLDDIMLGGNDTKAARRPPPSKTTRLHCHKASTDSTEQALKSPVSAHLDELFFEPEVPEKFYNGGTLKDENFDCFSDRVQWKKKNRKRANPMGAVDRLISEGNTEYENLFLEGKMKKRERKRPDSPQKNEYDENQSLSLF